MTETPGKQNVAGVWISKADYAGVVRTVRGWIAESRRRPGGPARYITVTSVHGIVTARRDVEVRRILNEAVIATSDGMPVVWAMRSFGVRDQQRVYGPTLMLEMCRDAAAQGHRIFLYGSSPQCIEKLRENLLAKFPSLPIAGAYSPPFRPLTPEEDAEVVRMIRDSKADIVFVGISTPKQEKWMAAHVESLPGTIMVGVGAAFDFHAGLLRQAPAWMQRNGLEWFYRLCVEPKRLWRRYVLETPRFLPLWALQKLGWMRF
jgi:N-acetylglucosaminyldiphosphoundecaprenol N-acetyl-beta-D-mannosaminyltransferase